jgi:hypothetical protein
MSYEFDWSRLDRELQKATEKLRLATDEEDFQTVGFLCREALISLAQTIYDKSCHQSLNGIVPSNTDTKRMLEAFFAAELSGSGNEESRKHAKASVSLAHALVHRRTASYRDAALCLEAITSTVNLASILTGRTEQERTLPAVSEPFRIPKMNDPTLKMIIEHYNTKGKESVLPLLEEKDVKLAAGYLIAYYPGTHREVWVGYHGGRYELILMLKPHE